MAKEYAEWLILNPRDEDILYPDEKKKKKKGKGKGMKRSSTTKKMTT
jgi:hypothetical protein